MCRYYLALSMDRADPARKRVAREAIENLKQFDDPESNVQPAVRVRLGKLHLAAGDYAQAREALGSVISGASLMTPRPSIDQIYEARYFLVAAHLASGDVEK